MHSQPNLFINAEAIKQRVGELAQQISADYQEKILEVICLVGSASFFCTDLIRQLTIPTRLHFLSFNNYSESTVTGEVKLTLDVSEPLYGKEVLLMEGIIVSGRTPHYLINLLQLRQPASLNLCAFGVKNEQLAMPLPLKYVGFELGSEVVAGYGIGTPQEKAYPYLIKR